MAEVFDTTPENVLTHLRGVFAGGELEAEATAKEFLVVWTEGRRRIRRRLKHYNLDAIVSVDYPVAETRCVRRVNHAPKGVQIALPDRSIRRAMKAVLQSAFSPSGA